MYVQLYTFIAVHKEKIKFVIIKREIYFRHMIQQEIGGYSYGVNLMP